MPDIIIFIDTSPEASFERSVKRMNVNIIEKHPWDNYQKQKMIYELFEEVLFGNKYPALCPIISIENSGSLDNTIRNFDKKIMPYFE